MRTQDTPKRTERALTALAMLAAMFVGIPMAWAQQAPSASGGDLTGAGGTLAFTVGLVAYDDATGGGQSAQQGVQHAYGSLVTASYASIENATLQVYPNPTDAELHVVTDPTAEGFFSILRDMQGRIISQQPLTPGMHTLDLRELAAGTYVLTVQGRISPPVTHRIVKR